MSFKEKKNHQNLTLQYVASNQYYHRSINISTEAQEMWSDSFIIKWEVQERAQAKFMPKKKSSFCPFNI